MNLGVLELPAPPLVVGTLELDKTVDVVFSFEQMLQDGASIIELKLANDSSLQDELTNIIPSVEILSKRFALPIAVHTSNPDVMQAAADAGAKLIIDQLALSKPGAVLTMAKIKLPVCLIHTQHVMMDVVSEVYQYLQQRINKCLNEGIDSKKIIIDPGLNKNLHQNLVLIRALQIFKKMNYPILIGLSHEKMIGQILDVPIEQRTYGSLAAAVIAISNGAEMIRTSDVRATADAIKVIKAIASI